MSEKSEFVTGLYRLSAADTKLRLVAVRKAINVRLDELKDEKSYDHYLALQTVADDVSRILLETSRLSVERLDKALMESRRELGAEPAPDPRPGPRLPKQRFLRSPA
ncbi:MULTISPECIES: hypothetical protein [unclassified Methylobacterium]|uniref:hypothetical protein n=1 Tax=unclassified Methylobacterium TaxID=2615210 RepID=UPI0022699C69|nr:MULTISPECIES: hypothetical protein [unclassified Methylobacterium]